MGHCAGKAEAQVSLVELSTILAPHAGLTTGNAADRAAGLSTGDDAFAQLFNAEQDLCSAEEAGSEPAEAAGEGAEQEGDENLSAIWCALASVPPPTVPGPQASLDLSGAPSLESDPQPSPPKAPDGVLPGVVSADAAAGVTLDGAIEGAVAPSAQEIGVYTDATGQLTGQTTGQSGAADNAPEIIAASPAVDPAAPLPEAKAAQPEAGPAQAAQSLSDPLQAAQSNPLVAQNVAAIPLADDLTVPPTKPPEVAGRKSPRQEGQKDLAPNPDARQTPGHGQHQDPFASPGTDGLPQPDTGFVALDRAEPTATDRLARQDSPLITALTRGDLDASAPPAARRDAAPPAVAHDIARQLSAGFAAAPGDKVEVILSPEELGRVRMTILNDDRGLTMTFVAERPETLDLMRRNIDSLAQDFRGLGFGTLNFAFSREGERDLPQAQAWTGDDKPDENPAPFAVRQSAARPVQPRAVAGSESVDIRL